MKYYLAPLEGITTYIFRNAYHKNYHPMDKYFSPFLMPRMKRSFTSREINDILPEHNQNLCLVPQLLTNQAEDFRKGAKRLMEYGYGELNLNLGCPSGTVVARNKGAGFLAKPLELQRFLDEIFSSLTLKISIKTRIGVEDPEEFVSLLKLFNKFPLEELIIHPRVRQDYYDGCPNLDVFQQAFSDSRNPVCYNGDIFSQSSLEQVAQRTPGVERVMTGRGILMRPWLVEELAGQESLGEGEPQRRQRLRQFHDEVYMGYQEAMPGVKPVLYKMKELWSYMIQSFSNGGSYAKKIRKAESLERYEAAVNALFSEQVLQTESCEEQGRQEVEA